MNNLLVVDLTNRSYQRERISETILDQYLGGRGLGAYLLYQNVKKGVDPLSPENILIFSAGPLQGTNSYYSSRAVVNTKSPLTGIYLFAVASGRFAHELKKAGYASIVIKGRSQEPVYLIIRDETVDFRPAKALWGLKTIKAQKEILRDAGMPKASCACIGPAGENLHRLACIVTEDEKARTFGRGGSGAVMGSKNLKGLVILGSHEIPIADKSMFEEAKAAIRDNVTKQSKWAEERRRYGTGNDIRSLNELGILPTRNWQTGMFEGVKGVDLIELEQIWPRKNVPCGPYCINPCAHIAEIDRGPWKGATTDGPEYETIYAFGPDCGVDQFDAIVASGQICDEYGIDTMSCGTTIAFAMECYEKGLITQKETGGLDLRFGNAEAMVKATEMIAKREELGFLFGDGVRKAAERIPEATRFAMHCKGLEFGGYECRGIWGQALQFALSTRGGCHHAFGLPARNPEDIKNGTQVEGKGDLVKRTAIDRIVSDSAIICAFTRRVVDNQILVKLLQSITGKDRDAQAINKTGLRILTLERMFNMREGLTREDDHLPLRLTGDPLPDGPRKGSVVPMDDLLDEGYKAFGWDQATGNPLKETLENLDLAELFIE
jgi:aldehyde:ferredoxin oxidoreductase